MVFNRFYRCLAVLSVCVGCLWWNPVPAFADLASDSNAADLSDGSDELAGAAGDSLDATVPDESDLINDGVLENEEDDEIYDTSDLLAYVEDIDRLVADIHAEIVPDEVSDQGFYSISTLSDDEVSEFSLTGDFGIDNNVVIYEGLWGSQSYRAVFPAAYEQYFIVTDEGYLYNVSGSSVTGRLFQDEVDYESYEYSSLVLNSVLGNVASTIYNYGYPSYVRTYYVSGTRISSKDTYGLFRVTDIVHTDSADPSRIGNNYMLVLIMIGGVLLLCFMKKSQA